MRASALARQVLDLTANRLPPDTVTPNLHVPGRKGSLQVEIVSAASVIWLRSSST